MENFFAHSDYVYLSKFAKSGAVKSLNLRLMEESFAQSDYSFQIQPSALETGRCLNTDTTRFGEDDKSFSIHLLHRVGVNYE